jgi:hypothetical protein
MAISIRKGRKLMKKSSEKISEAFSAGAFGGLLNGLAVWFFGAVGITGALGVKIAPPLSAPFLYPRIVWGGIWGFAFLLPFLKDRLFLKGLILSVGPTLIQLFVVFPVKAQKGLMGIDLGTLTPLLVILFNAVWGLGAAYWLKMIGPDRRLS